MSPNPLRGTVFAALAVAFGSMFVPAVMASAATTLTVGNAARTPDPIIPIDVGYQLGIFKKHGLDLKIVDFTGGGKMDQAMAAGALDIANSAGIDMANAVKGVPMMAVCESAGPFSFLGIGVPFDSPIKSVNELKGKTIGISSSGSLTEWLAKELARVKGWGPDGMTRAAIGNGNASIIAAFRAHLIDADIGANSLFLAMEEKKTGRLLIPVSDYVGNAGSGVIFASKHLIATDPNAVRAFIAAWIETIDYVRTHKAETVKIESAVTDLPERVMSKEYDLTTGTGMFTKACEFDAQSLATLKRTFVDLKLLDHVPDMSTLYTEAYLPK